MKPRCPACGAKALPAQNRPGMLKCVDASRCGGYFDPREAASGTVEGGTFDTRRPDLRARQAEEGTRSQPLLSRQPLRGGL